LLETVGSASILLDANLRIERAAPPFYRLFRTVPEKTEGRLFYEIGDGEWNTPGLRSLLEEVLPKNLGVQDFEIWQKPPGSGRRKLLLNAVRTKESVENEYFIIVTIREATPGTWTAGVRSNPRASAREDLRRNFCAAATSSIRGVTGVGTQESEVAGVAEYASKVFIRKSTTSISLGKSSPSSQIL
jgi:hypothetical protein